MRTRGLLAVAILVFTLALGATSTTAQVPPTTGDNAIEAIPLALTATGGLTDQAQAAFGQVRALLWRPVSATARQPVALVVMHESSDFTHHPVCSDLASRGFQLLCGNTRYVSGQGNVIWDNAALDVKSAVQYLRQQPDISKVFLLGHSGGGALVSYYENVAENGAAVCQDNRRITPCSSALDGLPQADGVILLDPIPGLAFSQLTYWDPSVTADDQFGRVDNSKLDRSLDMFSTANGYDARKPTYSADFVKRFFTAQSARNERLISLAQSRLEAIKSAEGWFSDEEPFIVNRQASRLWVINLDLVSHTARPHTLVTATGEKQQVAQSVRTPGTSVRGDVSQANFSYSSALKATVHSFLSTFAIHSGPDYQVKADEVTGVDWQSSNTSLVANLGGVKSPLLAVSMTGHYWLVTTEVAFDASPSADKTLAYIEGASHGLTTCKACETTPGQFGDTEKTLMDYIMRWLNSHT